MLEKIALVTGGTRGIGKAISELLVERGCFVIAGYLSNDAKANLLLQSLKKQKANNFCLFKADISHPEIQEKIEQEVVQKYGRVDILVNNAGITRNGFFDKMSINDWHEVMDCNLNGLYYVTKPILKSMLKHKFGRIINISSVNGQKGQYKEVNYSTTKAGIIGFTKALAQEVADKNITVNTISPGYIDTELTKTLPQKELDHIVAKIPVKRLGAPYEIARAVEFLADDKSGFITGVDLSINGGLHMK